MKSRMVRMLRMPAYKNTKQMNIVGARTRGVQRGVRLDDSKWRQHNDTNRCKIGIFIALECWTFNSLKAE